jgi:hypothetical protein
LPARAITSNPRGDVLAVGAALGESIELGERALKSARSSAAEGDPAVA